MAAKKNLGAELNKKYNSLIKSALENSKINSQDSAIQRVGKHLV